MLVKSEQATKQESVTFYKNIDKTLSKERTQLNKLTKKEFACETDAQSAMSEFTSQCQFLSFESSTIVKVPTFSGRRRSKKGEQPTGYHYQIKTEPYTDLEKVKIAKLKVDMFILATNDTDNTDLTMGKLLTHYKSQQKVDRYFRFLKSPAFLTSSIFLKKPELESLLMIMTLSLLVYAGLEHKIREQLSNEPEFFPKHG